MDITMPTTVLDPVSFGACKALGAALAAAGVAVVLEAESIMAEVVRTTRKLCGREYPVTVIRLEGLATYRAGGREELADAATFLDFGPRQGVTREYTRHREVPYTEAEREAGRQHIRQVAAQVLTAQGLW